MGGMFFLLGRGLISGVLVFVEAVGFCGVNRSDFGGGCVNGFFLMVLWRGWGCGDCLWGLIVSPLWPLLSILEGGNLGMLACSNLGMLSVFPPNWAR